MHENKLLYLLTHPCIFLLNKKLLFGEALCYLEDPTLRHWSPCFSVLPKLLVWHYTTQRSGHQVQHQCYLRGSMPRQWSPGDLPGVLRIWESIFDSQAFFTVQSFLFFFQGFPGTTNSTAKLAGFHTDLRNIAPAQLFVWRVLCHTFYLRARTGQSQTLIFKELLCYGNFIFERFTSYGIWTLSAIGENVTSLLS